MTVHLPFKLEKLLVSKTILQQQSAMKHAVYVFVLSYDGTLLYIRKRCKELCFDTGFLARRRQGNVAEQKHTRQYHPSI